MFDILIFETSVFFKKAWPIHFWETLGWLDPTLSIV